MAGSRVRDCVNKAVDALQADSELTALLGSAKNYTHVPQGTDTPYNVVRGGDEIPWVVTFAGTSFVSPDESDGGDNGARQVDVIVETVTQGPRGSAQSTEIASRIMEVLTDVDTWSGLTGFELAEFVRNAGPPPADLNNDGVLWFLRQVIIRVSVQ